MIFKIAVFKHLTNLKAHLKLCMITGKWIISCVFFCFSISERRLIAVEFQYGKRSVKWLRFKVLYAHANPQTIPEAMSVARKNVKRMHGVGKTWLENLDDMYDEIVEENGRGSHHMVD